MIKTTPVMTPYRQAVWKSPGTYHAQQRFLRVKAAFPTLIKVRHADERDVAACLATNLRAARWCAEQFGTRAPYSVEDIADRPGTWTNSKHNFYFRDADQAVCFKVFWG